jgi:predicted alpha-1,2-mannosidase
MIGYHSFPVIAEAYRKGFRDWDTRAVLDLMLSNSTRNDWWAEKGYIPADKEDQSVSKTLEFAYDDWTLSQFAQALGDNEAYKKFARRSQVYKNLFDSKIGFVRGRMADGTWRSPFDPDNSRPGALHDFTEGSAWQYTFFAPQDVPGLIAELGGREAFVKKLNELFERASIDQSDAVQDVTGTIGQYAHGNEPSHHVAYLYNYASAPAKTQQRVRQIRDQLYSNAKDGLCGNEDCGQMSAWYVFSALGFYPVNPVSGEYVLGVPAFPKAIVKLENGKTFTIEGDPKKKFVDKVLLNGLPLSRTYITHEDIVKGGKLQFVMSDTPDSKWGTKSEDAPH